MAATRKRSERRPSKNARKRTVSKRADSSQVNEKVLDQAVRALKQNPDTKSNTLYEMAQTIDPSIRKMDRRAFHMRYAMRARRILKAEERGSSPRAVAAGEKAPSQTRRAGGARKAGRKAATAGVSSERARNTIRALLTATMKEAVQAESKADIVALFDTIDSRTEQLLQLVEGR
jgi:hypothetical protein